MAIQSYASSSSASSCGDSSSSSLSSLNQAIATGVFCCTLNRNDRSKQVNRPPIVIDLNTPPSKQLDHHPVTTHIHPLLYSEGSCRSSERYSTPDSWFQRCVYFWLFTCLTMISMLLIFTQLMLLQKNLHSRQDQTHPWYQTSYYYTCFDNGCYSWQVCISWSWWSSTKW